MAMIAWLLILFVDGAFSYIVYEAGDSVAIIVVYNILVVLALTSHIRTMFTNPGAVPRCARALSPAGEDGEMICGRCDSFKPAVSHHCRVCGRCIVRMDHHCPWMNNCIGAMNQKFFVLFLTYTTAQCIFVLVTLAVRVGTCAPESSVEACFPGEEGRLAIGLVVLVGLGFLFVASMLYNQVYAVHTGIGTVDRMKRRARHTQPVPIKWVDVFGDGSYFLWPVPTSPEFTNESKILGFATGPSAGDSDTSPLLSGSGV